MISFFWSDAGTQGNPFPLCLHQKEWYHDGNSEASQKFLTLWKYIYPWPFWNSVTIAERIRFLKNVPFTFTSLTMKWFLVYHYQLYPTCILAIHLASSWADYEERLCYHAHSSPNESMYFALCSKLYRMCMITHSLLESVRFWQIKAFFCLQGC